MTIGDCPYCAHSWDHHQPSYAPRCTSGDQPGSTCGCMWKPPELKLVPPPRTPRDMLIDWVQEAIFDELDRQHEHSEIGAAGYWDREWGRCDGEPDWNKVATAALDGVVRHLPNLNNHLEDCE